MGIINMTVNPATTISSATDWAKLLVDAPRSFRSRLPGAAPQPTPGRDLGLAVDKLVQDTLARSTDPTVEKTYQESIDKVYAQFKARVSTFTVDPTVSKGLLLRDLVTPRFTPPFDSSSTLDLLIQKYCRDEIAAFQPTLQTPPLSEVEMKSGQIVSAKILQAVEEKITALTNLYSNPQIKREQVQKELYQALVTKYKPYLQQQITKLTTLDKPFKDQLDAAFVRDLKSKMAVLATQKKNLEQSYSQQKQTDLEGDLKRYEGNLATEERNLISLDPTLKGRKLTSAVFHLPSPPHTTPLNQGLQRYKEAMAEVEAKSKELATFLEKKNTQIESLEKEIAQNALFQASPRERERYICQLTSSIKEESQSLLSSLEKLGSVPVTRKPISAPQWLKSGVYYSSVAVGVCAIYYGLYCGSTALFGVAAQSSAGSAIGAAAGEFAGRVTAVTGSVLSTMTAVLNLAGRLF